MLTSFVLDFYMKDLMMVVGVMCVWERCVCVCVCCDIYLYLEIIYSSLVKNYF